MSDDYIQHEDGLVESHEEAGVDVLEDEDVLAHGYHHDETVGFTEKWRRVFRFMKTSPKASGEYKWAAHEMQHVYSVGGSIVVPSLVCLCLAIFVAFREPPPEREFEVKIVEPEKIEEIEIKPEEIPPVEPEIVEVEVDVPDVAFSDMQAPNVNTPMSQQPVEVTTVRMIKSPIVMKGIFGSRSPGNRGAAVGAYGGSGAGQDAVLRALRWLKFHQESDGSWAMGMPKAAGTGLGLLCFLAHGDTPATSREFGMTVRRGIEWLVENQKADGSFPDTGSHHSYGNGIATYAMCEAAALTKIVAVREAATKAIQVIIDGQQAGGGWDYNYNKGARADTSVMAWQMQSLKAAYMAGLENEGLHEAMELSVKGMQANAGSNGFGYTGPGNSALTAAGTLCMQLLNAGDLPEAKRGKATVAEWNFSWEKPFHKRALYHWYYATQARFHTGGASWNTWNDQFSPQLVKAQIIEPTPDGSGKKMGHWLQPGEGGNGSYGPVYSTTLCCLMLEVYYRYLPTFKTPEGAAIVVEAVVGDPEDDVEIDFDIGI